MKVANRKCIWRLGLRSLRSGRSRNMVAALAIALTALLFTSLFTIALSVNEGIQQAGFRQAGGYAHGVFKYLTEEQFKELKDDPLIESWGLRRFLGMPEDVPFNKAHVELGYSDANNAHWMYCDPVEGRLPREGSDEAATDTRVLSLLGVEPRLGEKFSISFTVDGKETTQSFTLCGWWEYDEAVTASHVLLPESRVDAVLEELDVTPPGRDGMTGAWNMDVMLKSGSRSIGEDIAQILSNHGYQNESLSAGDNYIATGVNWAYTGAKLSENLDPVTALIVLFILAVILLTGYLIIYNVFQISVAGDIRFYGLLKTIGTTPRQLKRIIRIQALSLSAAGIPLGLLLGWAVGSLLVPVIVSQLSAVVTVVSVSPWIFLFSAAFALVTVLISCRRPGRMAARVSPVEAVRYTEGSVSIKAHRSRKGVSLFSMARANLGRSRGKTFITVLSLSLAVLLLTMTVTLTGSFDMDKYVSYFTASDFIVGNARQFQTREKFNPDIALPKEAVSAIQAQGGIKDGGLIYGRTSSVEEFVTEEYYRNMHGRWNTPEQLDAMIAFMERNEDGLLSDTAQLYGMEDFALGYLRLLEGDLSKLENTDGNYIAAVYSDDDYGNIEPDSHWAKLGDKITLRYVEEFEYYNGRTGEVYGPWDKVPASVAQGDDPIGHRAVKYRDVEYTVAALVVVPNALSYGYYGSDEFVMGAETFIRDTGTDCVMYYAFDTVDDEANAAMESFLEDFTENTMPELDYESKSGYAAEFESTRNMFNLLGGSLSFIVGLVGVLNFINAIFTGIAARRRELAVLQAIGMTGRQLKTMLAVEGLLYTLGSAGLSLALTLLTAPLMSRSLEKLMWFLSYRFQLWPIFTVLPFFALLGIVIPILSYRSFCRHSTVERLRQE